MFHLFRSVAALLFDTNEPKISWYLHQYFSKLAVLLNPSYPHPVSICSTIAAQFMILFLLKNPPGRNLDHCSPDSMWKKKWFCGDPPPLNYTEHIKILPAVQSLLNKFSLRALSYPIIRPCCPEITPVPQKGGKLLQFLLLVVILKNATHISDVRILFSLSQSRVFFELAKVYASESPFWRDTSVQAQ